MSTDDALSGQVTPDRRDRARPRSRPVAIAAALVVAAALLGVFIALAVVSGPDSALSAWDRRVSDAFIAWRTGGRNWFFWAITLLGNVGVLAAFSVSAVVLLVVWGKRARAILVAGGLLVGWGISEAAKLIVGRGRPPAEDALIAVPSSASMPSGHALTTLVFLGLLVYLAFKWRLSPRDAAAGPGRRSAVVWAVLAVTIVVAGLIGVSRVYLGVHWLSDVLGGWSLGGAWLALFLGAVVAGTRNRSRQRLPAFLCGHPPARMGVRVATVAVLVILCVVAYILSAWADPLLVDL